MPDAGVLLKAGAEAMGSNVIQGSGVTWGAVILYTNNHVPVFNDDNGAFDPCALTGGDLVALTPGNWVMSAPTGKRRFTYPTITYTFAAYVGSPVTIYGYFIADDNSDAAYAVKFSNPYTVPNAGGGASLDVFFDVQNA